MIIAIDIGNTNIVVGAIDNGRILFTERISTNAVKTELEYTIDIRTIVELHGVECSKVEGGIVSSVVPQLTKTLAGAAKKLFGFMLLIVGPGVKSGLNIKLDNPTEIGADIVADTVAAISEHEAPLIVVDMGTATTVSVIDANKCMIGGLIAPGVEISLDALTSRAAQLSGIGIEDAKDIIGKNTRECMRSGIVYGNAAMLDGIISRIEKRLERPLKVIATGGISRFIVPYCEHEIIYDEDLLLKGLWLIYSKNKRG